MSSTAYDSIANYYDLSHAGLVEDIPFLIAVAARNPKFILELGCGSGRLLIPLAEAGRTVIGLDHSASMLALAQKKIEKLPSRIQEKIALCRGKMTSFRFDRHFGTILIAHNTLMHLTDHELSGCLRQVRTHLHPEGELVIDLINPSFLLGLENQAEPQLEQILKDPETGETIEQFGQYRLDPFEYRLHLTYRFYPASSPPVSMEAVYQIRLPHQLQLACQEAGLKVIHLAGNYQNDPYREESSRLIITAQPH